MNNNENFEYFVIEEFLRKHNFKKTLDDYLEEIKEKNINYSYKNFSSSLDSNQNDAILNQIIKKNCKIILNNNNSTTNINIFHSNSNASISNENKNDSNLKKEEFKYLIKSRDSQNFENLEKIIENSLNNISTELNNKNNSNNKNKEPNIVDNLGNTIKSVNLFDSSSDVPEIIQKIIQVL